MVDLLFLRCERDLALTLPHDHSHLCVSLGCLRSGVSVMRVVNSNHLVPSWAFSRLVVLVCV